MANSCEEVAVVTAMRPGGQVEVKVRRAEACHSCAAKGACTTLAGNTGDLILVVDNPVGAAPGDQVTLTLDEASVIKASAVLYLVPALGLVGGAVAGWLSFVSLGLARDPATALGALGGLGLGLMATRLLGNRMGRDDRYTPRLRSVVSPGKSVD
jgi:sigma-E factor negative regulatory protein RseC